MKMSFDDLVSQALSLNAFSGSAEPVRAFRRKGDKRILIEFGLRATALQLLVRDVLKAVTLTPENEYATEGRGRDAAVSRLRDELNGIERPHLVLADLKGYFPSIRLDDVCKLIPVPRSVAKCVIFVGHKVEIEGEKDLGSLIGELNKDIREGLPQGSLLSPLVASVVMSSLMAHRPCLERGLTYVDDIAVPATSKAEVDAIKHALYQGASAHLSGPTSFKRMKSVTFKKTFKHGHFLGYQLRVGPNGQIRLTPTPKSIRKFVKRLGRRLSTVKTSELHNCAMQMAESFRGSSKLWDFTEEAEAVFEAQITTEIGAVKALRAHKAKQKANMMGTWSSIKVPS